jgi:hypothetical protein
MGFYYLTDPRTTVSFITNLDTFYYADFDFNNPFLYYYTLGKVYGFSFFDLAVYMQTSVANFPIQQEMTMDVPYMNYFLNGRKWGSQPDIRDSASNGSTLKLTVTSVHFDATFSGVSFPAG